MSHKIPSKVKQYTQRFRDEWLLEPELEPWIQKVSGDLTKASCKYCNSILNARRNDLIIHGRGKKHQDLMEPFSTSRFRQTTVNFSPPTASLEQNKAECALALYVALHGAANSVGHLMDMCKVHFGDSRALKDAKLHRTKCSNIVCDVLSPHFCEDLIADIGNSKYSLLLDESNDIATEKVLGVVIRYFSKRCSKIVVTFLGLQPLERCDAEALLSAIEQLLAKFKLPLEQLIAVGTDNASVMVGINNGVYQQLKKKVPKLLLIRCLCHSVQLAVSSACFEHMPRNVEFMLSETYNWFSRSAMRQATYHQIFSTLHDGGKPLKFIQLSTTRWLSVEKALKRVLSQWDELKLHFSIAKEKERCYVAQQLYASYNDPVNKAYFLFLKPVLADVQRVNKAFENSMSDPTRLLEDLSLLIETLIKKVVTPSTEINVLNTDIGKYRDTRAFLGYEFETFLWEAKLNQETVNIIRKRCIDFIMHLIKELRQRLPDNIRLLRTICRFNVEEVLRVIKDPITDIAKLFTSDDEILSKIHSAWQNITLVPWKCTTSSEEFWVEVLHYKDSLGENPFQALATIAINILLLPHSNADVECLFSHMNIVKRKLRNRLKIGMVNSILAIRYGLKRVNKCCYDYECPEQVLKKIGTMATYSADSGILDEDDLFNL